MKPGNSLVISLHSVNPEQTLGFCHLVGFKEMSKTDESILLTDGMKLFEIKPSGNNFTSLTYLSDNVKGKKEQNLFETLAIRAMAKAAYSTRNIGHYGLSFDYYTHFTSPIRRYPDIMVHRLLEKYLDGERSVNDQKYEEFCKISII